MKVRQGSNVVFHEQARGRRWAGGAVIGAALIALLLASALRALGAGAGEQDAEFGRGGHALLDFGAANDFGNAVAIQPDGKIIVAGAAGSAIGLARLDGKGALDRSFGNGGKITVNPGGGGWADGVALQADGKVVVVGSDGKDFVVIRYTNSGALDGSFSGGVVRTDFAGGSDAAGDVVIQPDGLILVAGAAGTGNGSRAALARYLTDGRLDESFGTGGKRMLTLSPASDAANAVALQPDGRIVVAGTAGGDAALARLHPRGGYDASFGGDGILTLDLGGLDVAQDVALQPDGKPVVALTSGVDFIAARFLANGEPDAGFGNAGVVRTPIGSAGQARAVVVQPDGKVILVGSAANRTSDMVLARYNAFGQPDLSFGVNGVVATDIGSDVLNDAALDGEGRLVVVGATFAGKPADMVAARYLTAAESAGDNLISLPFVVGD